MAKEVVVYNSYNNQVAFRGDLKACKDWVFNQAFKFEDGRRFFRHWEIDNRFFYDVGSVYYTFEKLI